MDGATIPNAVPHFDAPLRQTAPLWKVFGGSRPINKLGIIRCGSSHLLSGFAAEEELFFLEELWSAGWYPAVIFEETLRDYPKASADYDMLILGAANYMPSWLQEALIEWINNGGTLVCAGPPGVFDPWGRPLARLLWETLGTDEIRLANADWPQQWRINSTKLKPTARITAFDRHGIPLVVQAKYGRGEIIVTLLTTDYLDKSIKDAALHNNTTPKLLRHELLWRLNERVKREIESPERNLYLDWRPCDDPRTFFSVAINLSPYAAVKTQVIAHGAYSRVLNLSADGGANPVPCERTESITSFPLELPPGGGAVLMLERAGRPPRRR